MIKNIFALEFFFSSDQKETKLTHQWYCIFVPSSDGNYPVPLGISACNMAELAHSLHLVMQKRHEEHTYIVHFFWMKHCELKSGNETVRFEWITESHNLSPPFCKLAAILAAAFFEVIVAAFVAALARFWCHPANWQKHQGVIFKRIWTSFAGETAGNAAARILASEYYLFRRRKKNRLATHF